MVALGHCTPANNDPSITSSGWIWFTSNFISSFDMPLFMFFSGFLFGLSSEKKELHYSSFMQQRAIKMLIPFFVLGTIGYFLKLGLSQFAVRPVSFSWDSFLDGFLIPWHNPVIYLWFLPTLFIIYGILFFMKYLPKNAVILWVLGPLIIINVLQPGANIYWLNINFVIKYMVYFALGFAFYGIRNRFQFLNNIPFLIVAFILFVLLNLLPAREALNNFLTDKAGDFILAVFGILVSLSLGHLLARPSFNFLKIYDGLYFCSYLLSWFIITGAKLGYQRLWYGQVVTVILIIIGVLTIPLLAKKYITQSWAKTILGLS